MAVKVGHLFADLRNTRREYNTSSNKSRYTNNIWRGKGLRLVLEMKVG